MGGALNVSCAILVGGADIEQDEVLIVERFLDEGLRLGHVDVGFDFHSVC